MLASGLPEEIDSEEPIARFVFSRSNDISMAEPPGCLKPAAFLPNIRIKPLETSVFRHGEKPEADLWKIAKDNIPDREPKGVGILKAHEIKATELEILSDEKPPNAARHANIVGWDDGPDPKQNKAAWKLKAVKFASKAKLIKPL